MTSRWPISTLIESDISSRSTASGRLRVTAALRGNLEPGSKVAIVTSRMGSIEDNTSGGRYGYRMSKCAVNMAGRSLAHDLKEAGVAVAILHPGFRPHRHDGSPGVDRSSGVGGWAHRED